MRVCASEQIAEEAEAGGAPLALPLATKVHNNYAILLMELGRPRQVCTYCLQHFCTYCLQQLEILYCLQ